jgi:hypothetical protein
VNSRQLFSLVIGIGVSAICLWAAFRQVDLPKMAAGIQDVDLWWIFASVLAAFSSLVLRAFRWKVLLSEVKAIRFHSLVSAIFIGMMANNLLPARLGEVVRAWVIARRESSPVATVLATIVVERVVDVVALLFFLGLGLLVVSGLSAETMGMLRNAGVVMMLMLSVAGVGLLTVVRYRVRLFSRLEQWQGATRRRWILQGVDVAHRFVEGLVILRGVKVIAMLSGLSILIWGMAVVSFYILANGFPFSLSYGQSILVFVIVLFGIAIPSAPGFVGTFHGFCVAGLALVAEVDPTSAAAYATLLHGSHWLAITVLGMVYLMADRSMAWSDLAMVNKPARDRVRC